MNNKEREAEEARLAGELRSETFKADTKWIMKDPRGRRFVARLLKSYGEDITSDITSFTGNSTTFELEGMRKAAKLLQSNLIRLEPDLFLLLLKENFIPTDKQEK